MQYFVQNKTSLRERWARRRDHLPLSCCYGFSLSGLSPPSAQSAPSVYWDSRLCRCALSWLLHHRGVSWRNYRYWRNLCWRRRWVCTHSFITMYKLLVWLGWGLRLASVPAARHPNPCRRSGQQTALGFGWHLRCPRLVVVFCHATPHLWRESFLKPYCHLQ